MMMERERDDDDDNNNDNASINNGEWDNGNSNKMMTGRERR